MLSEKDARQLPTITFRTLCLLSYLVCQTQSFEYYTALVDVATSLVLFFLTTQRLSHAAMHGAFLPSSHGAYL